MASNDWEPAWSSNHERWFYQDRKAGLSSWEKPPGCTIELPKSPPLGVDGNAASNSQDLPPGWECEWDTKHGKFYYFNRKTRERVWKRPQGAVVPPPDNAPPRQEGRSAAASSSAMPAGILQDKRVELQPAGSARGSLGAESGCGSSYPSECSKLSDVYGRREAKEFWDPKGFLDRLNRAKETGDPDVLKVVRKEVAEHNYNIRFKWPVPKTSYVSAEKCLKAPLPPAKKQEVMITFSETTTADAVFILSSGPTKPRCCALNFANGVKVGGGYKNGAHAQEEDLCRRIPSLYSSLFEAKRQGLYPFGPSTCQSPSRPNKYSDVLWTPDLVLGRSHEDSGYQVLPPEQQVSVALIGAAAPNIRFARPPDIKNLDLMYNTVKTIFLTPRLMDPEINTIILGAWGCGAFGGDAHEVGELFCKALQLDGLGRQYSQVHFAVPRFGDQDRNPDIIKDVLTRNGVNFKEIFSARRT